MEIQQVLAHTVVIVWGLAILLTLGNVYLLFVRRRQRKSQGRMERWVKLNRELMVWLDSDKPRRGHIFETLVMATMAAYEEWLKLNPSQQADSRRYLYSLESLLTNDISAPN